jgi:hypothetical protein
MSAGYSHMTLEPDVRDAAAVTAGAAYVAAAARATLLAIAELERRYGYAPAGAMRPEHGRTLADTGPR